MILYLSCQQGHLLYEECQTYGNNYRSVCKPYFIAYAPASFLVPGQHALRFIQY